MLDGGGDRVGRFIFQCDQVVVLDEHQVEQAHAMVVSAAARDRVFFKSPPAGRRFTRVENLRRRVLDGVHELRRERRNAGQPLDKIQRHALGAQNRVCRAGNFQQNFIAVDALAVFGQSLNFDFSFGGWSDTTP